MVRTKRLFEYQALHDSNNIRVIELLPAIDRNKPIIINLRESSSESPFKYEALSYTWDDQKPTRDITCNEARLQVTENVFQALRQLRISRKPQKRVLWIDAICINQNDQAEKTSQVSMMGKVYARAERVNIWLSHSTEAMREMFEYTRLSTSPKLCFDHVSDGMPTRLQELCWLNTLAYKFCRPGSFSEGRPSTIIVSSLLDQGLDCAGSCTKRKLLDLPRSTEAVKVVNI